MSCAPFEALRHAVDNSFDADPVGGVSIEIQYTPQSKRYHVDLSTGEATTWSQAPTLELALCALEYLDEGEGVLVDHLGMAKCHDCGGRGCDVCNRTGLDPSPPHAWPAEGIRYKR